MSSETPQVTYVYRLFNESDELLYVGITKNTKARFTQHSKDKPWWAEVETSRVVQFRTLALALAEESTAILWEQPKYNLAIPTLARHDLLQARAEVDPLASLDMTQRLELAESATRDLGLARAEIKHLQAANEKLAEDLRFEREAGLRARADVAKLSAAVRQQDRTVTSLTQVVANAALQSATVKKEMHVRDEELAHMRAEVSQAHSALEDSIATSSRPFFARRKPRSLAAK